MDVDCAVSDSGAIVGADNKLPPNSASSCLSGRHHLHLLRYDRGARTDALQAAHDDVLAGLEARGDDAQPFDGGAERHLAVERLVFGPDDEDELLALIGADGALVD